jgi:uncharacterized protein involved in exopolysaccharide biosynthesis
LIIRTGQFELIDYALSRWRFIAIAVSTAVLAAMAAGFLLPRRFTATASILIDAPGGLDPRAATEVSPVYLESLRTYEHFASSDSLFADAIRRLHIREQYSGVPVESLKSLVLKVSKPRDTKILEISATLDDPRKAQALAQYIAEQTVSLNRSLDRRADDDLTEDARGRVNATKARVAAADREFAAATIDGVEGIRSELDAAVDLDARVRRDLAEAKADLADALAQEPAPGADRDRLARQIAALRGRIAELQMQQAASEKMVQSKQQILGRRQARLDSAQEEQKAARAQLDAAQARLNDLTASAGLRTERLKIIDPGIVPERPSAPNRPALVISALMISSVLSVIYIAVAFHFRRPHVRERERSVAFK